MLSLDSLWDMVMIYPAIGVLAGFLFAFMEALPIIGTVVPGIALMSVIGYYIGSNIIPFYTSILFCILGALSGDYISYWVGLRYQHQIRSLKSIKKRMHLIEAGEALFDRYGAISLIIGRFIGPIRSAIPLIAGFLKLKHAKFMMGIIPSACLWSVVYLFPGILYGAFAMHIPKELFMYSVIILSFVLIITFFYRYQEDIAKYMCSKFQPYFTTVTLDIPITSLIMGTLVSWGIVCWIVYCVSYKIGIAKLDPPIFYLMQSFYTPSISWLMLIITQLGDTFFPLTYIICWGLLALKQKNYRLIQHLLLNVCLTVIIVHAVKLISAIERPPIGDIIANTYSFPSGHTAIVMSIIANIRFAYGSTIHTKVYNHVMFIFVFLAALSRVYLGMHWLTDVIAAIFIVYPIISFSNILIKPTQTLQSHWIPVNVFIVSAIITAMGIAIFQPKDIVHNMYAPQSLHKNITTKMWRNNKIVPTWRYNRLHTNATPFNIQWLDSLKSIDVIMMNQGWTQPQHYPNFFQRFDNIRHPKESLIFPLFPQLYLLKPPIRTYTKESQNHLYILRLWKSRFDIDHQPLWLGDTLEFTQPDAPRPWKQITRKNFTVNQFDSLHNKHILHIQKPNPLWDGLIMQIRDKK